MKFVFIFFLLLASVFSHAAADHATTEQVKVRLIASVNAVHPGDEIVVGLHQQIIPHWHTYWLNPGDSGLATTIKWSLPEGATAGEIQWPIPNRIKLGPATNYGYENEVTLLSSLKVPSDIKAGANFAISAKVNWLVCEEVCIPQEATLGLILPVVAAGEPVVRDSPLIDNAQAALPVKSSWPAKVEFKKDGIYLHIASKELQAANIKDIWFYGAEWGKISHGAAQPWQLNGDDILLQLQPGDAPLQSGEKLFGVLALTEQVGSEMVTRGFTIDTANRAVITGDKSSLSITQSSTDIGFISAILLALLGGVILNLMPCVFPILSMKALSLLKHAHQAPRQTKLHGVFYTAGVLASFAVLGGVLIALKIGGAEIGWGFQFQSPLFVLILAYLMFAVGLNLSGVFSVSGAFMGIGSSLTERNGYAGSFFTGVLATLVATPCTAPFMGVALGYAVTQPPIILMAIFLSLGLGVALPYLLLSVWPTLQRLLPRPGAWMEYLKQGLAFPMYGAAAWLIWVLAQQAGANTIAIVLVGFILIAFSLWAYQNTRSSNALVRRSGAFIASISLLFTIIGSYVGIKATTNESNLGVLNVSPDKNWQPYSPQRLQELRAEGKPVFLNLTAAWCITCLVNERVALKEQAVIDSFSKAGITYLKGDWTNRDATIAQLLAEFGRSGVPLYVFYPSGVDAKPIVLPQILTPGIVLAAVEKTVVSSR